MNGERGTRDASLFFFRFQFGKQIIEITALRFRGAVILGLVVGFRVRRAMDQGSQAS